MGTAAVLMTCLSLTVVDGDTVQCDGQKLRDMGDGAPDVSGYDTPEIYGRVGCPEERELGLRAAVRMADFLRVDGLVVEDSGVRDDEGRPLVVLRLPDGSTVGRHLIDEGLARVWLPDVSIDWCN